VWFSPHRNNFWETLIFHRATDNWLRCLPYFSLSLFQVSSRKFVVLEVVQYDSHKITGEENISIGRPLLLVLLSAMSDMFGSFFNFFFLLFKHFKE
jgi:hypothetical protein